MMRSSPKKVMLGCLVSALLLNGCTAIDREQPRDIEPAKTPQAVRQQQMAEPPVRVDTAKFDWERRNRLDIRGIYVSGPTAGNAAAMNRLMGLFGENGYNAVVIDVKNDSGQVTYDSVVPEVDEIGSDRRKPIADIERLLHTLKGKNIYTIARLVVFKDPFAAGKKPGWAIQAKDGRRWTDRKGLSWVDPYNEQVQQYNVKIALEAASLGFDEIQFDYVRFPENGAKIDREVRFQNPNGTSKADHIKAFLRKAKEKLHAEGVYVSADVFGLTTTATDDMGIGQDWAKIAPEIDFISPMIYPSHYSSGNYGLKHPDLSPYPLVKKAVSDALSKQPADKNGVAVVRPWYQAFTAKWVHPHQRYGTEQIGLQIRAAKEQGVHQYLLWNPSCRYPSAP